MFKFLLIISTVFYVIYKVGMLFFRAGAASRQFRNPPPRREDDQHPGANKRNGNVKGGEYVDYEEVK
jgi:hypothetical protein